MITSENIELGKGFCPKCYTKMEEDETLYVCPQCFSSFQKGTEVQISLSAALALKSRAEREKRLSGQSDEKPKSFYKRKKKVPHTTGFYGVSIIKKRELTWRYKCRNFPHEFRSTSLSSLRSKVKASGGKWEIVYLPAARRSADLDGTKLKELK